MLNLEYVKNMVAKHGPQVIYAAAFAHACGNKKPLEDLGIYANLAEANQLSLEAYQHLSAAERAQSYRQACQVLKQLEGSCYHPS